MSESNTNEAPKPGTKAYYEAELAAAQEELAALKAEKAEWDSQTAAQAEPVATEEEKVEIFVPRGYANDEPHVLIAVNGVNYLLPRGKSSKVPRHIAEEFNRSQRAQARQDENIEKMLGASK